jgi:hypothetical protein
MGVKRPACACGPSDGLLETAKPSHESRGSGGSAPQNNDKGDAARAFREHTPPIDFVDLMHAYSNTLDQVKELWARLDALMSDGAPEDEPELGAARRLPAGVRAWRRR